MSTFTLFAGYNTTSINGDEMDGPGKNWIIWPINNWPTVFDSYVGLQPMILTVADLEVFTGCADYVVPCQRWNVTVPYQPNNVQVRRAA